ncbi:MAG: putative ABC transporter permease [Clostridiales bacterium]|nr:putative ABC transporter permease [Clostridiales bacterium]
MKTYYFLFLCFIVYSFLGWLLEVLYHIYTQKRFINRGFLYGPICPIYGFSAVLFIILLNPFKNNPISVFLLGSLIASFLELITGYILDLLFNTKWWDYSNEKLNFKGYICARFSVYWGLIAVIFMDLVHPEVFKLINFINTRYGEKIYSVLFALILIDSVLTLNSLYELKNIYIELHDILSEIKSNMDKLNRSLPYDAKTKIENRIESLLEMRERVLNRISFKQKLLIRSYPTLRSKRFSNALSHIIEKYKLHK